MQVALTNFAWQEKGRMATYYQSLFRARSHPDFHWLIPDHVDTTATSTLAAYDRIIVVGEQLRSSVIPGSAGVLRFDEQMGLGEEDLLKVATFHLNSSSNSTLKGLGPLSSVLGPASVSPPVSGEEH